MELTATQTNRRKHLEYTVKKNASEMGEALLSLHREKLYRSTHKTWEAYCHEVFGMSKQNANRIIEHGKTLSLLSDGDVNKPVDNSEPIGSVLRESHTREVAGLPDEQKVEILTEAVETAPKVNGKPKVTAKHVRETRAKKETPNGKPSGGGTFDPAEWDGKSDDTKQSSASVINDAVSRPVPAHLADCHEAAAAINSAAGKLDAIKRTVVELAGQPGGEFLPKSEIEETFKRLKGLIAQSRYYTECPKCCGKVKRDCKRCDGNGFLPYSRRGVLSDEEKAWLGI